MKVLIGIICCISSIIVSAQDNIVVDANAVVRNVTESFTSVKVSGGFQVYITQSETPGIAVSASDEKYLQEIKTEVKDNMLRIYYDGSKNLRFKSRELRAYISIRELNLLDISGRCNVSFTEQVKSDRLTIKLSGASDLTGTFEAEQLTLELSGASDISLNGTVSKLEINSSGASDVNGKGLITDFCNANMSGASDLHITVNEELNVNASGASQVHYSGTGVLTNINVSGASTVRRQSTDDDDN